MTHLQKYLFSAAISLFPLWSYSNTPESVFDSSNKIPRNLQERIIHQIEEKCKPAIEQGTLKEFGETFVSQSKSSYDVQWLHFSSSALVYDAEVRNEVRKNFVLNVYVAPFVDANGNTQIGVMPESSIPGFCNYPRAILPNLEE